MDTYPHKNSTSVRSDTLMSKKYLLLPAFQKDDADFANTSFSNLLDFSIGTADLLSTGHTCTKAFRVVLMKFAWKGSVEQQAYARISGIGQCNKKTLSYRLYCFRAKVESIIIKRQLKRLELHPILLFKAYSSFLLLVNFLYYSTNGSGNDSYTFVHRQTFSSELFFLA